MSYSFDPFNNQYFRGDPIPYTYPIVYTCWVKPAESNGYGDCISSGRWNSNDPRLTLGLLSSGQSLVIARDDGGGQSAALTTAPTPGVWSQITARFINTTTRRIYLNGGAESSSSNPRIATAPDATVIGKSTRVAVPSFNGLIAHPSIWTYTDGDDWTALIAALQTTRPQSISAGTLLHYWPDFGDDAVGSIDLTGFNNPVESEDEPAIFVADDDGECKLGINLGIGL